ncbi:MAG: hypothetical protein IJ856_01255, partial [Candidatus Methanomethylophilaceae archaeon]|nr:hypothetical protein [Candidatus Methanomethylophilaceae archaeon]
FQVAQSLFGKGKTVTIEVDGATVAEMRSGERLEYRIGTGNHVFKIGDRILRHAVESDTGCMITLGRNVDVSFVDPRLIPPKR